MIYYSTQSLVITSLVFVCLILNIVGLATPIFKLSSKNLKFIRFLEYNLKTYKHNTIKQELSCNEALSTKYCIASRALTGVLLSFSSLLFLLTISMLFLGYNNIIKLLSIILNILIVPIVGGLITVLILISIQESNFVFEYIKETRYSIKPSIISYGISAFFSIITACLFTTLKLKAKKL